MHLRKQQSMAAALGLFLCLLLPRTWAQPAGSVTQQGYSA